MNACTIFCNYLTISNHILKVEHNHFKSDMYLKIIAFLLPEKLFPEKS